VRAQEAQALESIVLRNHVLGEQLVEHTLAGNCLIH
jgi:hypothetical protein